MGFLHQNRTEVLLDTLPIGAARRLALLGGLGRRRFQVEHKIPRVSAGAVPISMEPDARAYMSISPSLNIENYCV